ncbi:MAG: Crp/Fnr family transcriptional regulator [Myxococcaceae bacterium]
MKKRPATKAELDFVSSLLGPRGVDVRDLGPLEAADLRKHELVLSAGDDPDASGLVVSGVLREFYLQPDGSEHTRGFGQTGDSFGSLSDSLQHRPSRVFVRAETAARVVFVPWSKVRALMKKSLAWERLAAGIVERLYLKKSVREYELLALDAMGRYQSMREQYPGLEQKVPATVIASYLGITNVHLSRLRRRLKAR